MNIKIEHIIVSAVDGEIFQTLDITNNVKNKIKFNETVGDEKYLKASDIKIIADIELSPWHAGLDDYIVIYLDDEIYNIYINTRWPYTAKIIRDIQKDDKTGLYYYRIKPLQKRFYDDLKNKWISNNLNPGRWNYQLYNAYVEADNITVIDKDGNPQTAQNRYLFVLSKMLDNLEGKCDVNGYTIGTVDYFFPSPNEDNLPVFFRGLSYPMTTAAHIALTSTFEYQTFWADIFKILSVTWNCFIKTTPRIENNTVKLDIDFIPRVNILNASPIDTVKWLERRIIYNKYKLNGIDIICENYNYQYGTRDYLEKELISANNEVASPDYAASLYFCEADYVPGTGNYDDPSNYIKAANVAPYYAKMVENGDGFKGTVKTKYLSGSDYKYLKTLDPLLSDGKKMQITKIGINENDTAKIECIETV